MLKESNGRLSKKTLHGPENSLLDQTLYAWFKERRAANEPVSGLMIQAQAQIVNKQINDPERFGETPGYVQRWDDRHGIHQLSVQGEKLSADEPAAKNFSADFQKLLKDYAYQLNQVYNADETGLYWKSLPTKMLVGSDERSVARAKKNKDRLTVMFCANITGSHKIPLLVIGKSKKASMLY